MTLKFISQIVKKQACSILCVGLSCVAVSAWAAYPDKPIKIIVPWATGGATDQVGRLIAQPLSQALGVPVVVENKAGAGGVIGTQLFVKEKADGYTLLLATSSTNAAAPYLYSKLGFDPVTDFTPVVSLCSIPNVMVVPTKSPWNSLKDIVDASTKSPGNYTYGSAGSEGRNTWRVLNLKQQRTLIYAMCPTKGVGLLLRTWSLVTST
jgi:tripartite-type tricarboxylate transporter receptor subunit TctC